MPDTQRLTASRITGLAASHTREALRCAFERGCPASVWPADAVSCARRYTRCLQYRMRRSQRTADGCITGATVDPLAMGSKGDGTGPGLAA